MFSRTLLFTLFVLLLASSNQVCSQGQPSNPFVGTWQGALEIGQTKLRLVLKITQTGDTLKGAMDSPDQGASNIPASKVWTSGDSVFVEFARIMGKYQGFLASGNDSLSGTWIQGGTSLPLPLKRTSEAIALPRRPQTPVKPYPYLEEEVVYENQSAGIKFAATLTLPKTGGPFPAILLITGSGAQDRDESIFGHKPFLVLADHLTRRGIAVLRVDDRGVSGTTGNLAQSTNEDLANDVLAGIRFLKQRKEINPKKIGLIGHSEGGILAPMVAARSSDVAFIVMMAGTGLPGEDILHMQSALILRANGATEENILRLRKINEQAYTLVKSEQDTARLRQRLTDFFVFTWSEWGADYERQGIDKMKVIPTLVLQVTSPWFRSFLSYDPRPALRKVKCPVLAVNGEKDLQVPSKDNLREIEKALKEGGNKDFTMKEFPGLNHLFQTTRTGSPMEYGSLEETISPSVLQLIGDWIEQRMKK